MAEKTLHWNRHDEQDRVEFARFLAPLVAASRTKTFTKSEASAYLLTLMDVPRDVLAQAVTRLLQAGVTWMPRAGDIKAACCDVVDDRRRLAMKQAALLRDGCDCTPEGWRYRDDGKVERCLCWVRAQALIAEAGAPLARPALPAAEESAS